MSRQKLVGWISQNHSATVNTNMKQFFNLPILIGVAGFVSSIVTMFVDTNSSLSVKWFVALCTLFLYALSIMSTMYFNLLSRKTLRSLHESPFKYIPRLGVFLIKKNEIFQNNIIVGCYVTSDDADTLAYLGVVQLIQENYIQIKLVRDFQMLSQIPTAIEDLRSISVRSVIPAEVMFNSNVVMENRHG